MLQKVKSYLLLHKNPIVRVLVSMVCYAIFAYHLEREEFLKLIGLFALLFICFYGLIQFKKRSFKFLLVVGILFRLLFLIATPNLSQDFYRFIWDGELIKNGINPYLYTPNEIIADSKFVMLSAVEAPNLELLYEGMGELSAQHYSNYPPVNQLIFATIPSIAKDSIVSFGGILGAIMWMRILIILTDLGVLYFGYKLLQHYNQSPDKIFWYFLNPLVIVELTGNLHFEGVMLCLLLWAMYLIHQRKLWLAAPVYAASIMVKLVPLLLLPTLVKHIGFKKSVPFYLLVVVSCGLFFLPFYHPELIANYTKTLGLWFGNFEFNASIYNAIKTIAIGYFDAKPWELIKSYGTVHKTIAVLMIIAVSLFKSNQTIPQVFSSMLLLLSAYYLLSPTVHPWYLTFLLGLSVFTAFRFVVAWTLLITLSYFAYSQPDFKENLGLLTIEYVLVIGYLAYEVGKNYNIIKAIRKKP